MKKVRFTLSVLFLLCIGINAIAQSKITLRGTVVDNTNQTVIGASVIEKGTTNGTVTDYDGKFVLTVSSSNAIIQISYIGFDKMELPASSFTGTKKIQLKESSVALGEVVAIGYGKVKKSDATGSVVAIKAEEINRGMVTTPADLLVGKVAGVNITTNGGAPGAASVIRIRGGSSMSASNDPLIVIDDVPVDNRSISGLSNPLSSINPNDIETFTVLKDASATAIYGSRASNGVIIITTKKGKAEKGATTKPKFAYNGVVSVSIPGNKIDIMSPDEYRAYIKTQFGENSTQASWLGTANTNWQDAVLRTAMGTDHNISITGAIKGIPYRLSGNLAKQDGILKNSSLERSTIGMGLNPSFFNDHLKINMNVKGMMVNNCFADEGAIGAALEFDPTQPIYANTAYGNGYFVSLDSKGKPIDIAITNPMSILNEKVDKSTVYRSIGNMQFDYKFHFLPELRANLNLGYDISGSDGSKLIPDNSSMSWSQGSIKNGTGEFNTYGQDVRNTLLDYYMNYVKEISSIKSKIDFMGGYSWQHFYRYNWDRYNYINGTERLAMSDTKTESYIVSVFGRMNYTLLDRYLVTATLRNDGSSRFASSNRWGLFPSVALAWKIKEESFLKDVNALSDLKLRLGYGVTGQQDITDNDYPYIPVYQASEAGAYYQFGNQYISLYRPKGYDAKIKWEETVTQNIGLDFGFLNGRFSGAVDAYFRKTNNLINTVPVAAGTNFINELLTNVGNLENKGLELTLSTKPIVTKNLTWDLGYNISYNQNKITKLTLVNDPNYIGVEVGSISGGTGNKVQIQSVGFPVNSFYVYEQVYAPDGHPIEGVYVDRNGDGKISDADKYRYKKPAADVTMGLSSKLLYKDWDFSFNARCSLGNYVYNNVQSNREASGNSYDNSGFLKNRVTSASSTGFKTPQYLSDYYIQNASFLRLDNITLGYTLNRLFKSNASIRVYGTAQNPFVITKYTGVDPEFDGGLDKTVYPRPRVFLAGVSVNF